MVPQVRASAYIHVPFCSRRCGYCDFNIDVRNHHRMDDYAAALGVELAQRMSEPIWSEAGPLATVYLGGGTPSLMPPAQVASLLEGLDRGFGLEPGCEVTLEANPEGLDRARLRGFRTAGVTRLSLGIQSMKDRELAELGRLHSARDAVAAVESARAAGFQRLSIDLMFGIPGQTIDSWSDTLHQALDLAPGHVSVYDLCVEPHTAFHSRLRRGLLELPDEDIQVRFWSMLSAALSEAGYEHYEVSNWSRPGHRAAHNLRVWSGASYLGLGTGAHGFEAPARRRYWNVAPLRPYLRAVAEERPEAGAEQLSAHQSRLEWLMLRWRQAAGIAEADCQRALGVASPAALAGDHWQSWLDRGWVRRDPPWGWTETGVLFVDRQLQVLSQGLRD
jgi:oxygen-independent coproporphyrinogen-3 oxidase